MNLEQLKKCFYNRDINERKSALNELKQMMKTSENNKELIETLKDAIYFEKYEDVQVEFLVFLMENVDFDEVYPLYHPVISSEHVRLEAAKRILKSRGKK